MQPNYWRIPLLHVLAKIKHQADQIDPIQCHILAGHAGHWM
jgi:hypothetical protein